LAITLVGAVASSADTASHFTTRNGGANISGDDDNVEGTGAVGDKMSNTTELLVSDTLSGGASGVYDFSVGGNDEGAHIIAWANTKTPINGTTGIATYARNASGHLGTWNNVPTAFYKGGFVTRLANPAADFNAATTWTTTGNPAQLDDVSEVGFSFTTTTSIMGSFNNCQIDQITIGFGIRADAGTSGARNDFEDIRSHDEDTNFYGWWSGVGDSLNAKGGAYIGPATGTTASWFEDSNKNITFQDEHAADGFYVISVRGANTTCDFTLISVSAANPTNSRWDLDIDSTVGTTTGGFTATNCTFSGSRNIVLNANSELNGTTIIDGTALTQNNAILDGCSIISANTADGVAYITSDNPADIKNCNFEFSDGHAIEIDTAGTYTFDANIFTGYGTGNDAAIYNNSAGSVTLNIINGGTDVSSSVRNGTSATTTVNVSESVEFEAVDKDDNAISGVLVSAYLVSDDSQVVNTTTNGSGIVSTTFSGTTPADMYYRYRKSSTGATKYKNLSGLGTIASGTGSSIKRSMVIDDIADPDI